jgi:hypothetical protein
MLFTLLVESKYLISPFVRLVLLMSLSELGIKGMLLYSFLIHPLQCARICTTNDPLPGAEVQSGWKMYSYRETETNCFVCWRKKIAIHTKNMHRSELFYILSKIILYES